MQPILCSNTSCVLFFSKDTPAAPSSPRVVDTTKTSISLAWTKPTYDGGVDILGYVLEMKEESTEQWYRAHTQATIRNAEYTVTGLKTSQKYRFRVAATNKNGLSEYSESSAEIEPVERIGNVKIHFFYMGLYTFVLTYSRRKSMSYFLPLCVQKNQILNLLRI